jgi:hypothetical protein
VSEARDENEAEDGPRLLAAKNERVSGWHAAVFDSTGLLLGPWFWASTKEAAEAKATAHYEAVGPDPPTFQGARGSGISIDPSADEKGVS